MSLSARLFTNDEELGKKDDDHRPNGSATGLPMIRSWRGPRRKRLFLGIVVALLIYFFFKNMPTDLAPVSQRQDLRFTHGISSNNANQAIQQGPPNGPPPRTPQVNNDENHYFEGPIKFYNLAASLHRTYTLMGHRVENRNVLFAASSLKSASSLLPLACEMTKRTSNNVHFAIMGRDDIPLDALQTLNGVTQEDCSELKWHDGRPDYSTYSTAFRMEISIKASLAHINTYMHPQVVIIDGSGQEDDFLSKGIKAKASDVGVTVIRLPSNAAEKLLWITTLDSDSLKHWNDVDVNILIHAPPASSGSLIRLLKSIEKADYFGSPLPSITVELPTHVDPPTSRFLQNMRWPPHSNGEPPNSRVNIRHRIPSAWLGPVESSIRTIEAFYPKIPSSSNVLVLSPHAELSSLYFHYLKYVLLEYRYSSSAGLDFSSVTGISLTFPSAYLNGSAPFKVPRSSVKTGSSGDKAQDIPSFFLWQAPSSDATLYFGDKWMELHKFVTDRFAAQLKQVSKRARGKLISSKQPAWMEYLLEMMRAKGYFVLYPSFPVRSGLSIGTLHNELSQSPEEFSPPSSHTPSKLISPADSLPEDPFITHPSDTEIPHDEYTESTLFHKPSILHLLTSSSETLDPERNPLPGHEAIPLLNFKGDTIESDNVDPVYQTFASEFSMDVGGCKDAEPERLFCLDDDNDELPMVDLDATDNENGPAKGKDSTEDAGKPRSSTTTVLPTELPEVTLAAIPP